MFKITSGGEKVVRNTLSKYSSWRSHQDYCVLYNVTTFLQLHVAVSPLTDRTDLLHGFYYDQRETVAE